MPGDDPLESMAARIADGLPVDWRRSPSAVRTTEESALEELRIIAEVAARARTGQLVTGTLSGAAGPDGPATSGDGTTRVELNTTALQWGPLTLLERVGAGSFGIVFRAWDPALRREVALKLLPVRHIGGRAAETIMREGHLLARVRHPNVVTVYGAQCDGDFVGIWTEFIRGQTLADLVALHGPLSAPEAAIIGISLCSALTAVHHASLVHRDVKARNVLREERGRIVLVDFGAGLELQNINARPYELAGTPLYLAPELFDGQPASPATDVFSVGVLLFFLVTGRHPVEAHSLEEVREAHRLRRYRRLDEVRVDLPDAFVQIVHGATNDDPNRRYKSAAQVKNALADVVGHERRRRLERSPITSRPAASRVRIGGVGSQRSRTLAAAGITLGAVWCLGALMSLAFDTTLGRPAEFSDTAVFSSLVWGLRSLVSPVTDVVVISGIALLVASIGRLSCRLLPSLGGAIERASAPVRRAVQRADLDNPTSRAQWLVVLQLVALGAFVYAFADLIRAFGSQINDAPASQFAKLSPSYEGEHNAYRAWVELLLLVMSAGWYSVARHARSRGVRIDRIASTAGASALLVSLALLQLPYRVLFHTTFERVDIGAERCYAIGANASGLLLHCPGITPPRNRVVGTGDPRVRHTGIRESIFSVPVAGRVDRQS